MTTEEAEITAQEFDYIDNWRKINYLQPIYDEHGGNSTVIGLMGAEPVLVRRKIKTVLKNLAKAFAVDLSAAKQKYGDLVGRYASAPIPLCAALILMPVKMRKPLVKDDGAWGYVVLEKIDSWQAIAGPSSSNSRKEEKCSITFKDGSQVVALAGKSSVYSQFKDGQMVRQKYVELLHPSRPIDDPIREARAYYLRQVQAGCDHNCIAQLMRQYLKGLADE
ncbi:MAG: hypothetical protein SCK28_02760 [Bacillota bacterium]|nr:hypothetical protein [Bacillota bacterium]